MWEATTPVAIAESQDAAIKVYPNPTRDMLNVVIPGSGSVEISIVTLAGQVMHRATADTPTVHLDLGSLASGMYLLRVQGADGLTVQKITKL